MILTWIKIFPFQHAQNQLNSQLNHFRFQKVLEAPIVGGKAASMKLAAHLYIMPMNKMHGELSLPSKTPPRCLV
jgi:hypothetical protein